MKRLSIITLMLCAFVNTMIAQRISHNFQNVSMSDALKYIQQQTNKHKIVFIYNELEDFKVTTSVHNKSVPDAIKQVIGFYPIRMTQSGDEIYVECTHKSDRHLTGKILDEKGLPLEFADVRLLNPSDSAYITGGVTNASGVFVIPLDQQRVIARFSYIGYKPVYKLCSRENVGTIQLQIEATQLGEVTVKGERPQYQTKGNSIITNVAGTVLEGLHSTNELLLQVPGVVASPDGTLSVFGRGFPIYYINNRKVQNMQEITCLSPKDILNIELIRNPSARFDAEVEAVIKITTRTKNEGWMLQVKADEKMNDVLTSSESIDLGLKQSGLNVSAHMEYDDYHRHYNQPQIKELVVDGDTYRYVITDNYSKSHQKLPSWSANVDYEINERHLAGISYDGYHNTWMSPGDGLHIYSKNGQEFQRTHIVSDYHNDMDYAHVNTFYNAEWTQRLHTTLNLDYVRNSSDYRQLTDETTDEATISTLNKSKSRFHVYAGRLTFDYTLCKYASLSWGVEYNRVTGNGTADCDNAVVPPSDHQQWENNNAAYLEAKATFGNWTLSGGIRFEDVVSDYSDHLAPDANIHRHYCHLFPSIEICHKNKGWSNAISFTSRTCRPSFRQLSNYTYYDSEFTYQHGNTSLQPTILYIAEWSAGYKFINASLSYTYKDNLIAPDLFTKEEHSPILVSSFSNFDHASLINANISLQHNFHWWRPSIRMGVQHMFFDYEYMNEPYNYGKTEFYLVTNHYFDMPHSWLANAYYYYNSGGTQGNVQLKSFQMLNLSIQKSFLQDRLSLKFTAQDVFHKMKFEQDIRIRNVNFWQIEDHKYWNFSLSVIYRLNQLKTKYRGKSSANEQINRL